MSDDTQPTATTSEEDLASAITAHLLAVGICGDSAPSILSPYLSHSAEKALNSDLHGAALDAEYRAMLTDALRVLRERRVGEYADHERRLRAFIASPPKPFDVEATFRAMALALAPENPGAVAFSVYPSVYHEGWVVSLRTRPREAPDATGEGTTFARALVSLARAVAIATREHAKSIAEKAEGQRATSNALADLIGSDAAP